LMTMTGENALCLIYSVRKGYLGNSLLRTDPKSHGNRVSFYLLVSWGEVKINAQSG